MFIGYCCICLCLFVDWPQSSVITGPWSWSEVQPTVIYTVVYFLISCFIICGELFTLASGCAALCGTAVKELGPDSWPPLRGNILRNASSSRGRRREAERRYPDQALTQRLSARRGGGGSQPAKDAK